MADPYRRWDVRSIIAELLREGHDCRFISGTQNGQRVEVEVTILKTTDLKTGIATVRREPAGVYRTPGESVH